MQVTCPNCRARYAVDPLAIGPSGRIVQCARACTSEFEISAAHVRTDLGSRHDVQRLLAISGLDRVVPAEPEGVADQLAYAGFVVDNHHQRLHTPIPPHPGNPQGILRIDAAVSQPFHNLERHNCRVKPHRVLAVVVAAVLAAAPAAAADKPKPKPTDAKRMMVSKPTGAASMDVQQRAYLDAMKARKDAIKVINQTFGAAVKQAQRVYKDARAAAKSADAKNQAEAARKASIAAASIVLPASSFLSSIAFWIVPRLTT